MAKNHELGRWGEQIACDILAREGFSILERNFKMNHIEIDLVGYRDGLVVIAEVKTRTDKDIDPLEAVTRGKILRMVRAAEYYMHYKQLDMDVRFDLFAIRGVPDDYEVEHIPDAFYPPMRSYR